MRKGEYLCFSEYDQSKKVKALLIWSNNYLIGLLLQFLTVLLKHAF